MDLDHFAGLLSAQLRRPAEPVEKQLAALKRLSFLVSSELEAHFLAHPESYEDPAYLSLLCRLAQDAPGQALVTTPESPDPDAMYRHLLEDLSALTGGSPALAGGELSPAVDGVRPLAFTLDGAPCRYDAQDLGAWLDMGLLTHLNGLLAQRGEKKRFLIVDDIRLPGQLVFFRSPQWAGFFTAATGLTAAEA